MSAITKVVDRRGVEVPLERFEGISDQEIAKDIADTEAEVAALEETRAAEDAMLGSPMYGGDSAMRRMAEFRRDARPYQIKERQEFIDFLRRLQTARAAQ